MIGLYGLSSVTSHRVWLHAEYMRCKKKSYLYKFHLVRISYKRCVRSLLIIYFHFKSKIIYREEKINCINCFRLIFVRSLLPHSFAIFSTNSYISEIYKNIKFFNLSYLSFANKKL